MTATFRAKRSTAGRLLVEFLVSLGILFLTMGGNMAILHSSVESAEDSSHAQRAVELAQEGMEMVIRSPENYEGKGKSDTVGTGVGEEFHATTFTRQILLTSLESGETGLLRAQVRIEWDDGHSTYRLERYVRTN